MLFKDLTLAEQSVYSVTRRIKNHKTNSFYHAVETIADHMGKSKTTARKGLQGLIRKGILKREERPGTSAEYFFIAAAPLSDTTQSTPHPPRLHTPPPQITHPNNSDLTYRDLTTTDKDLQSYNYLCKKFTKDVVDPVVVNCRKLNGDARNFWGLVHWSCQTGITPTNKTSQESEAKAKRIKFVEEQSKKQRKEKEKWQIESDNSDRELANNLITDFLSKHGDDE